MRSLHLIVVLLFVGCAFGANSLDEIDPNAIPLAPTYAVDVAPIVDYYCLGCHDPTTAFFEDPALDSLDGVIDEYEGVVEEVFGKRSMPPGGAQQLTPREAEILSRWGVQGFAP